MLLGPSVLSIAASGETAQVLADFGVVFLMFKPRLEFSMPRMLAMHHEVLHSGDVVLLYGTPEALDRGEVRLLTA